jgi:hypothetical protein
MLGLSLWEPWATLVMIGAKRYETRGWSARYRGPILIHAAKRDQELKAALFQTPYSGVLHAAGFSKPEHFKLGCALGIVDLIEVYPSEKIRGTISQQEHAFGDYSDKRFAWQLENIRIFEQAIPMKGMQKLFEVDRALLADIREQMIGWHRKHGVGIVKCPACGHVAPGDREIIHDAQCADPQREVMP